MPVDQRLAIGTTGALQTEQAMVAARGADAFRAAHPDEAISWNAALADLGHAKALAGERLDRKPPQLRHVHALEMPLGLWP